MMDLGSCSVVRSGGGGGGGGGGDGGGGGGGRMSAARGAMDKSPMGAGTGFTPQHHSGGGGGGVGPKMPPSQQPSSHPPPPSQQQAPPPPTQPLEHAPPSINRSPQMGAAASSKASGVSYFPSPHFPSSAASLQTPPLHHPPLPTPESGHPLGRGFEQAFAPPSQTPGGAGFDPRTLPYPAPPKDMSQTRPLEHVSPAGSNGSRKQQQGGGASKQKHGQGQGSGGGGMGVTPHGQSRSLPPSQQQQSNSHSSQPRSGAPQPPPPAHQTSGSGGHHPPAPSPSQQSRSGKRKQASSSSSSQSKKKPVYSAEIDANLSHNIFDSQQNFPSFFSLQNMSPPPPGRNMQGPEGPPFLTGNFFGASSRQLSNAASGGKNGGDLGPPYSMFPPPHPPSRPQNSLGLNFQHSFGMQAMGSNHAGGPMTPHSVAVTPHMSNFSLGNLFSDVAGGAGGDSGLNISPIKFPHHHHHHANPSLLPPHQPPSMDPNHALQHGHQGGSLYHQGRHPGQPHMLPNAMALNSFLGHNHHHGFDARGPMGQGLGGGVGPSPFHGAGHPSSFTMPSALNFSMQDH